MISYVNVGAAIERRHLFVFVTLLRCWHQTHANTLPTFNGLHLPYWVAVCHWNLCSSLSSLSSSSSGNLFVHIMYLSQPFSFYSALDFTHSSEILSRPFDCKRVQWYQSQTGWQLWKRFYLFIFNNSDILFMFCKPMIQGAACFSIISALKL